MAPTASAFMYRSPHAPPLSHPIASHNTGYPDADTLRDGHAGGLEGECRMLGTRDYAPMCAVPDALRFVETQLGGLTALAKRNRALAVKYVHCLTLSA